MKKDEGFVNRHGHRTDLNRIDLSGVSVDEDDTVAPATPESKRPKSHTHFRWTRRHWIITGIVFAVLILIPLLTGEIVALRYNSGAASVHNRVEQLIKNDILPAQKQTPLKVNVISDAVTKVENLRSSICDGGFIDNMAMLYPRAKSAHDNCIKKTEQLSQLSGNLKRLEAEARYTDALLTATRSVTASSSEPYAVISAQLENWQAVYNKAEKLSPPSHWTEKHAAILAQVKATADGWSALNTAHNTQNKAGFEAAEKALNASYEGIRKTVNELTSGLHQTQNTITTARKSL